MEKQTQTIQRVTSKGQITLPAAWRKNTGVRQVVVGVQGDTIKISPARLAEDAEYTVFDAIRDNKGKGLKAKDLSRILKKIDS